MKTVPMSAISTSNATTRMSTDAGRERLSRRSSSSRSRLWYLGDAFMANFLNVNVAGQRRGQPAGRERLFRRPQFCIVTGVALGPSLNIPYELERLPAAEPAVVDRERDAEG